LENSFMIEIIVILVDPASIFIVFEDEIGAGDGKSNNFTVLVKSFCELLEARVGLSLSLHI